MHTVEKNLEQQVNECDEKNSELLTLQAFKQAK